MEFEITVKDMGDMQSLAKVGTTFKLDSTYHQVQWYGRGPQENYSDRFKSAHYGVYEKRIEDLYFPYPKPQENGNRMDVHELSLTSKELPQLIIKSTKGFNFSAHRYSLENLASGKHFTDVKNDTHTTLNIDYAQMGLGGDKSWQPLVHEEFLLNEKKYSFGYTLTIENEK